MLPAVAVEAQSLQYVYWIQRDTDTDTDYSIRRGLVGGSEVETIVSGEPYLGGLDVDPQGGTLYWTSEQHVFRSDLSGAQVDTLMHFSVCGIGGLGDITLDLHARMMYLTSISDCTEPFTRADLEGSNVEHVPIISDGMSSLAIDSTTNTMYWVFYGINRANPDEIDEATQGEKVVADVPASDLTLDLQAGAIYWTEYDTGMIRRANLDGSAVEDVLTELDKPLSITLDPSGGKLYWTEREAGTIRRANLDGTDVEDVFTGLPSPGDLAVVSVTGTSIAPTNGLPGGFTLEQNYPNPFNPTTDLRFELPIDADISLIIYDALGREVTKLVDRRLPAGKHRVRWDATFLPSGVYVARMQANDFVTTRQLVLVK